MINIVDYAQNGYLSSPYVVVNSVSFPDTLIDTLGGQTGTGYDDPSIHNWSTVFKALLSSIPNGEAIFMPATYQTALTIYTAYLLPETLIIEKPVIISGEGSRSTIIKHGGNDTGIVVEADGVVLEHFYLDGLSNSPGTMQHGIVVRGTASVLRHIYVNAAALDGVRIEEGADRWQAYHVQSGSNTGMGFFVAASLGTAIGLDLIYNHGGGLIDNSDTGNTYVGCHTAGGGNSIDVPSYVAKSGIFLGCYAEFDQLAPAIKKPAIWIGAESPIPVGSGTIWKDNTFYIQKKHGGIRFENKVGNIVDFTAGSHLPGVIFEFGSENDFSIGNFDYGKLDATNTDEKTISLLRQRYDLYRQSLDLLEEQIQLKEKRVAATDREELEEIDRLLQKNEGRRKDLSIQITFLEETLKDTPNVGELSFGRWRLEFNPESEEEYRKWYQLKYYVSPPPTTIPVYSPAAIYTAMAFSSTLAASEESINGYPIVGNVAFPLGFFMGRGTNRIKVGVSNEIPTEPANVGDMVFNNNPIVGGPAGWVYAAIASGGGAWKSFGLVEP